MNYQKLDAALSMAIAEVQNPEEPCFVVFIHTQSVPNTNPRAILERLDPKASDRGPDILSATLSTEAISHLSGEPWVKYIRLSQKLHPLGRSLAEVNGIQ